MNNTVCILAALALTVLVAACRGGGLPDEAQQIVDSCYADFKVDTVMVQGEGDTARYVAKIPGDVVMEFDSDGAWISVKDPGGVPAGIVPAPITAYVKKNYMGRTIVAIERTGKEGYRVDLYGGTHMIFDAQGKFIKLDYPVVEVY